MQGLKWQKIELELSPDPDIYKFLEKGTGGRISNISNRYSAANNKYLKSYDQKKVSKKIIYLDANNLHGYEMSNLLPTIAFKRIDPNEFDLNKYTSNSSKVCVFVVNLEYPKEF